ncbi:MAG TPA: aminotransferase class I/II-fold pyridoxal phosphate-dependent enzyme [Actinomycetota bacterium]|nr:aminotransferase class I/II-fold pyridoxal phosphate-dependent enzyme [Actinomycetota bacterium]
MGEQEAGATAHGHRAGRPGFATRAVHGAAAPPVGQRPASTPIYQTSTWRFDTLQDFAEVIAQERDGFVYGRGYGNPTVAAFEATMASLEGTGAAMAFDSGMAAVHTVATTLARSGDRIVASPQVYGGTYSLLATVLPRYGIAVDFVDPTDLSAVETALEGAAALYVETIANPLLTVADLAALGALCARTGVPAVVDNTVATPYLCTPAAFGFTHVLHSASKYIGGHSDLIGGAVCASADAVAALGATARETGGAMQPLEAWLCLRGLATLALRVERHCATAQAIAELLAGHRRVTATRYPGLPGDPSHGTGQRILCGGSGGLVAFDLEGGLEAATAFCEALTIPWIGASLGGPHTLVAHPASTTHRQIDPEVRRRQGMGDGFIRLSTGLEDPADLLADIEAALAACG